MTSVVGIMMMLQGPTDGCGSCMRSHPKKTQRLECYPDSLIVDITDAVYGAVDQQPNAFFDPSPSMCNITEIPKVRRRHRLNNEGLNPGLRN